MDRAALTRNTLRDLVSHLGLRVTDIHVVLRTEEHAQNLGFAAHGLAAAGRPQLQSVGAARPFPVQHNHVAGLGVDAVIHGVAALKKLLRHEWDKDGGGTGGQRPLGLHHVVGQGQARHEALFLLPVQAHQLAVVLLGDAGRRDSFKSLSLCSRLWTKIKKQQIFSDLLLSLAAGGSWYSVLKVWARVAR